MSKNKKKKKEKIIYIDDGSTVADMSFLRKGSSKNSPAYNSGKSAKASRFKECFKTYIEAVKTMIKPMLVTMIIITIAFLLVYLIL
jgi:hypothetical protein